MLLIAHGVWPGITDRMARYALGLMAVERRKRA